MSEWPEYLRMFLEAVYPCGAVTAMKHIDQNKLGWKGVFKDATLRIKNLELQALKSSQKEQPNG